MSIEPRDYDYPTDVLRNRIVLITGASDGIGRALALEAAKLGAQVILHGRNTAKLENTYDEIEAIEGAPRPSIAVMDLATAESVSYQSLADSLAEEFGRERLDNVIDGSGVCRRILALEPSQLGFGLFEFIENAFAYFVDA